MHRRDRKRSFTTQNQLMEKTSSVFLFSKV